MTRLILRLDDNVTSEPTLGLLRVGEKGRKRQENRKCSENENDETDNSNKSLTMKNVNYDADSNDKRRQKTPQERIKIFLERLIPKDVQEWIARGILDYKTYHKKMCSE